MPPAVEPVSERLDAAIKARLLLIVAGSTYWHTVRNVTRGTMPTTWEDLAPFVHLEDVREGQNHRENTVVQRSRRLDLVMVVPCERTADQPDLPATLAHRALADLEVAIWADLTWGGLATHTLLEESAPIVDLAEEPFVIVRQRVVVFYRTVEGDPTTPT